MTLKFSGSCLAKGGQSLTLLALLSFPLHAGTVNGVPTGFMDTTCFSAFSPDCVTGNSYSETIGTTTYTYAATATGTIVNGKPTIGTFAQMTVDDPNGVPIPPHVVPSTAEVVFTDLVSAGPAAKYSFTLDFHTIISDNYFQEGFNDDFSQLTFIIFGYDANGNSLWNTSSLFQPTFTRQSGDHFSTLHYVTPNIFFDTSQVASLGISLDVISGVYYSNFFTHSTATDVTASSDASHTVILQSIQALDGTGSAIPMNFVSSSGADYSAPDASAPEPATGLLLLAGVPAVVVFRRRRS